MFQPTHLLVSRTRKTPVRLEAKSKNYGVYTEHEWLQNREPALEFRPKLGLFCQGVQLVGHQLEPLATEAIAQPETPMATVKA